MEEIKTSKVMIIYSLCWYYSKNTEYSNIKKNEIFQCGSKIKQSYFIKFSYMSIKTNIFASLNKLFVYFILNLVTNAACATN